jgi:hypothetical protein
MASVESSAPGRLSRLRAGPVTALLEGSFLRRICWDGQEVLRGIYGAVRDHNWGTVAPRYSRYDVSQEDGAFAVRFTAEHQEGDVDFVWDGEIAATADGEVRYRFDGRARSAFRRNRIGLCLLHPMDLAGQPVEVETPQGITRGTFPVAISPHQPFLDIVAVRQRAGDASLEVRFEGDLFEMEDQRNWTDASYKTYSTPLRLPYPVAVAPGDRVRQTVTLRRLPPAPGERTGGASSSPSGASAGRAGRAGRPARPARPESSDAPVGVRLTATAVGALPPLGLGLASDGRPLAPEALARLRHLRPAHLHVTLDLSASDGGAPEASWRATLQRAAAEGAALEAALQLEVVAGASEAGLDALAGALRALPAGPRGHPAVARAFVYPAGGAVSDAPTLRAARRALEAAGVPVVGGGTRADFVVLNRAADAGDLPLDLMDAVAFAVNPQVHAFDDPSLVETLVCQGVVLTNARRIAGDRPVFAGPVTLRQRLNPAASGPTDPAAALAARADPRQGTSFAAGWTLGSVRHLATAGAAGLTYFETAGPLGVTARDGAPFPLWHLFAALAPFAGATLLHVAPADPLAVEALALGAGERLRLLVANLTAEARVIALETAGATLRHVRPLETIGGSGGDAGPAGTLRLPPFGVAVLDGTPDRLTR